MRDALIVPLAPEEMRMLRDDLAGVLRFLSELRMVLEAEVRNGASAVAILEILGAMQEGVEMTLASHDRAMRLIGRAVPWGNMDAEQVLQ